MPGRMRDLERAETESAILEAASQHYPKVTSEERREQLRRRRAGAQLRRIR
jgi:hypothetical protein